MGPALRKGEVEMRKSANELVNSSNKRASYLSAEHIQYLEFAHQHLVDLAHLF